MATMTGSHEFHDPISGLRCVLQAGAGVDRLRPGLPGLGVMHGTCPQLADVSPDLDCFYCPECRWNGRISGAWAMDMLGVAAGVAAPEGDDTDAG